MEQVRSSLEQTEKGKVSNAAANYKRVFQLDPLLKGAIRKNLLTERVDIVKPLGWYRDSPTLTDVDIKYLLLYFEENYGLTIEKKIQDAVMVIANENRYHPVRDFLNALQWDGIERIRYCLHRFLGADADDYTCEAMRLFLLGAISRAFRPGCKFEIMLCLVGGQGAGKSSFFRLLAVQDDWFSDDLKKLDDENVYRKMQGHWLIEMSEMIATANAKSIEEIKSFLSRQKETYKVPYETHPADRKRQCVFCGTSNTLDFLPLDRTGNRRFVPVIMASWTTIMKKLYGIKSPVSQHPKKPLLSCCGNSPTSKTRCRTRTASVRLWIFGRTRTAVRSLLCGQSIWTGSSSG